MKRLSYTSLACLSIAAVALMTVAAFGAAEKTTGKPQEHREYEGRGPANPYRQSV